MNYIEALQKRYSVKKFDKEKKVDAETLKKILEAGKLSASSLGLQPYKIYVVESPEMLEKMVPAFYNPSQISSCSHLLVLVTHKNVEDQYVNNYFSHISGVREVPLENLEPFRNSINKFKTIFTEEEIMHWNEKQSYLLLGTLMFAAALEAVDTSPMEGFRPEVISEILGLDAEKDKVSVTLALGYRATDDKYQTIKKVRKPDEMLYKFL